MSNILQRQISLDGWRNAVVKWTGVLDSSDETIAPALALSELTNNDVGGRLAGLRLDKVQWSIDGMLNVILEWNAATPQLMQTCADTGEACYTETGGVVPDRLASGYDGSVNLRTTGFPGGTSAAYTVHAHFVKLYD